MRNKISENVLTTPVRRVVMLAAAVALVAAACGGDDDTTSAESAPAPTATTAPAVADDGGGDDTAQPAADQGAAIVDASAEWSVQNIGPGIKPALALASDGSVAIAYMTEALEGGVFYATQSSDWAVETIVEGYFYGPIDLAFDPAGNPNIAYHDHQGTSFSPDAGDLTVALNDGAAWTLSASGSPGHDGWDSTLRFGPNGELWAAGIEPKDFGTDEGLEFYEFDGAAWSVASIGGPPITYQFNVSIATGADGEPVLSYYDDGADQLRIATRSGDAWTDEVVPTVAGGGQFSSLVIDANGTKHVSFFAPTGSTTGDVFYATDDGSGWSVEAIHTLNDVRLGMTGARRITSLQLLSDGTPIVATTDKAGVWTSTPGADGWTTELVLAAGDQPLGQQVQLVVGDDAWHLTTFAVTSSSPLEGEILYLERQG